MAANAAIDRNQEALSAILASLIAMAGLTELVQALRSGERIVAPVSLNRVLRTAVLRILRPAEAAARRLIVVLAQGVTISAPFRPSKANPSPAYMEIPSSLVARHGRGTGIVLPANALRRLTTNGVIYLLPVEDQQSISPPQSVRSFVSLRRPNFQLLDPIRSPFSQHTGCDLARRELDALPDATRLACRLAALAQALGDLQSQAQRLARWRARQEWMVSSGEQKRRTIRRSPLRPGRPPGGRLSDYDPVSTRLQGVREVDQILAHSHALALYALDQPDTS